MRQYKNRGFKIAFKKKNNNNNNNNNNKKKEITLQM